MKGAYTYYAPLIVVVIVIIISCFHSKGVACNYAPRPNIGVGGGNQINYGLLPFCPLSIGEIGKELFFIGRTEKKKKQPQNIRMASLIVTVPAMQRHKKNLIHPGTCLFSATHTQTGFHTSLSAASANNAKIGLIDCVAVSPKGSTSWHHFVEMGTLVVK